MSNCADSERTAAIVLGGGLKKVEVHGQVRYEPEEQAKARLDRAYALFEEGKADYIISTGKYSVMASVPLPQATTKPYSDSWKPDTNACFPGLPRPNALSNFQLSTLNL